MVAAYQNAKFMVTVTAISRPQFQRFQRNLAGWRSSALVTVQSSASEVTTIWRYTNVYIIIIIIIVTMLKFQDIQNGGGQHPKKLKLRYLGNGLTDRHSIWHDDAYWPPNQNSNSNFELLKIQDGGGPPS